MIDRSQKVCGKRYEPPAGSAIPLTLKPGHVYVCVGPVGHDGECTTHVAYSREQVAKWCEPPPIDATGNDCEDPAVHELRSMLDALRRDANEGVFELGRYEAKKRLSNGYEVTFSVCEAAQNRTEAPEIVCPACGHCFTGEDAYQVGEGEECPECKVLLVCDAISVFRTWRTAETADTLPPSADDEETKPYNEAPLRDDEVRPSSAPLAPDYEVADEDGAEESG